MQPPSIIPADEQIEGHASITAHRWSRRLNIGYRKIRLVYTDKALYHKIGNWFPKYQRIDQKKIKKVRIGRSWPVFNIPFLGSTIWLGAGLFWVGREMPQVISLLVLLAACVGALGLMVQLLGGRRRYFVVYAGRQRASFKSPIYLNARLQRDYDFVFQSLANWARRHNIPCDAS